MNNDNKLIGKAAIKLLHTTNAIILMFLFFLIIRLPIPQDAAPPIMQIKPNNDAVLSKCMAIKAIPEKEKHAAPICNVLGHSSKNRAAKNKLKKI